MGMTPEEALSMMRDWQMERYKLEAGLNAAQCWLLYGALVEVMAHLDPKRSTSISRENAIEGGARAMKHYSEYFPEALRRWQDEIRDLEKDLGTTRCDYEGAVSKFDATRAALAGLLEHLGEDISSPDDFEGAWHDWLIRLVDKVADPEQQP